MKKWDNNNKIRPLSPSSSSIKDSQYAEIAENNVCFMTNALDWVEEAASRGLGTLTHLVLFRHATEMLDSLVEKIRNGEATAGQQTLRSLFEGCISTLYIIKDDSNRRSMAYLFMDAWNDLKRKRLHDPRAAKFIEHEKLREVDLLLKNPASTSTDTARIDEEEAILKTHPLMEEAYHEYLRLKKSGRKVEWHTFYDGPRTIKDLAISVNLGASYEYFYTRYSGAVHPSGIIKPHVKASDDGSGFELTPLRRRQSIADELTVLSAEFVHLMLTQFFEKYSSPKLDEVNDWMADFRQSIWQIRSKDNS